jgi:hypothetical protein
VTAKSKTHNKSRGEIVVTTVGDLVVTPFGDLVVTLSKFSGHAFWGGPSLVVTLSPRISGHAFWGAFRGHNLFFGG